MTSLPTASRCRLGDARIRRKSYACALLALVACSPRATDERAPGRIVVALTVDWEGAYLAQDGVEALDALRNTLHDVAFTHFVSAAYFTKREPDADVAAFLAYAHAAHDEVAVHLHGWRSLAVASGVEPKPSPSFMTGTDERIPFAGDDGFDTDLDAYDITELRTMLRTSRTLLEQAAGPVSRSFRAGGYLATPKVLQAIRDEGFTVDSSALDHRQLDELEDPAWRDRLRALWPNVTATTQPFLVRARSGDLVEMPIAAVVDYATTEEIVAVFDAAHTKLRQRPHDDVFVVLALHFETAGPYLERLRRALEQVRGRRDLSQHLHLTTLASAAARASIVLQP